MGNNTNLMMYDAKKRSTLIAYLFWFFLGWVGAHRFYIGKHLTGLLYIAAQVAAWMHMKNTQSFLWFILIAAFWLIDGVLIPFLVRKQNVKIVSGLSTPEARS